ncbi:TPA: type II secretion system protein GspJ, partial [Enterobacter cloacae subsp. cloacae]|nr:type II secretion system protein GspJ [Enterobacter cloacae subsp. cloacae]
ELLLTMENGDTWRWVFTTPGDMPVAPAAPAEQTPAPSGDAATPAQPQPQPVPAPSGENK